MNINELNSISKQAERWTAEQILLWAAERFAPKAVMTCSFGGGGIVLAHMLSRLGLDVPVVFLDTGYHFEETLAFKDEVARLFRLRVITQQPALTVREQDAQYGPRLYERDPDLCCRLRKVEPLAAALRFLDAKCWIAALRRDQAATRRGLGVVEPHGLPDGRTVVKVHPMANWTRADVERYIDRHGLPRHPLARRGYASIGCWPCTAPAAPGHERSGRWPGTGKTECGLHTFTAKLGADGPGPGAPQATSPPPDGR